MPLTIPDDVLRAAGMTESQAKVEIACRLFDAGKLTIGHAAALAALPEAEFEAELQARQIPRHRLEATDLRQDVATLQRLGRL